VATLVTYAHSFPYSTDPVSGRTFPGLPVRLSLPGNSEPGVDVEPHLDSGAELSIFDGRLLVRALRLDLMAGREVILGSVGGSSLTVRIHRLMLSHPDLGRFTLDAAISTVPIKRNLLGRDFFQRIQIGFREFHQIFLVATAP
jgi:hypothetical protein